MADVGFSTICPTFKQLELTRLNICHVALQRNEEIRGEFIAKMLIYKPKMFHWVDNTRCQTEAGSCIWLWHLRGTSCRSHNQVIR